MTDFPCAPAPASRALALFLEFTQETSYYKELLYNLIADLLQMQFTQLLLSYTVRKLSKRPALTPRYKLQSFKDKGVNG